MVCSAWPFRLTSPDLLAAVLGVVSRIGLVGHQSRQVGHQLFDVGVDRDRRAVVAKVVVETRPRLIGHYLVLDRFGVGERVIGADPVAQRAGERLDAFGQPLGRDFLADAVCVHPVGQRTVTTQHLVEAGMRLPVRLRLALADAYVEVVVHLVDETDVFAGELTAGAFQRAQVSAHVVGALSVKSVAMFDIWKRRDQPSSLADQIGRVGCGLSRHRVAQRRVAGERVDVTRLDAVEPQTE